MNATRGPSSLAAVRWAVILRDDGVIGRGLSAIVPRERRRTD